jgi:F-type H+-transporting ATPase subunit b
MAFSWSTFLFQVVNFLVLLYILRRFVYIPLFRMIDERRATIARAQEATEEARAEAETMRQQLADERDAIEQERLSMIEQAQAAIAAERVRAAEEARAIAEQRRVELTRELEEIRRRAESEMVDDLLLMAVSVVERLLHQIGDVSLHEQLCRHLVETLRDLSTTRQSAGPLSASLGTATLEVAQDVDDAIVDRIIDALEAQTGHKVPVTVVANPQLIAGVRLQAGGYLWDSSLAGLLDHARGEMKGVNSSDNTRDAPSPRTPGAARPD